MGHETCKGLLRGRQLAKNLSAADRQVQSIHPLTSKECSSFTIPLPPSLFALVRAVHASKEPHQGAANCQ